VSEVVQAKQAAPPLKKAHLDPDRAHVLLCGVFVLQVPIEKVFNKSLLNKFHWCMDVESTFRF